VGKIKIENERYVVNTSSNQRTEGKKQEYNVCLAGVRKTCGGGGRGGGEEKVCVLFH
jgi:hypothetical protein